MNRYMTTLSVDRDPNWREELQKMNIQIVWESKANSRHLAISTNLTIDEVRQLSIFASVDQEPVGRINI